MRKTKRLNSFQRRKQIHLFQNRKVNVAKYVGDFYLENDIAFISCNVKDYYDIISTYSVDEYEWLNDSFASFIESNANYIPAEYPIVIEICGTNFTDKQKEIIENTILDYYGLRLGDMQLELSNNFNKLIETIVISIFGYLLITLIRSWFGMDSAAMDISTIFFWAFVWRIADLYFERRDLTDDKIYAAQLASVQIRFRKKFVDEKVDDKVADEVITSVFEEWEENIN